MAAKADRLAGAGAVHHEHRNAALNEIGHAAHILNFLGHVEAVEEDDARLALGHRILRVHEITGQAAVLERHFDDVDLDVGQLGVAMKAFDARAESIERLLVLGRAEAFRHLVVVARAQVGMGGGKPVLVLVEFLRVRTHPFGDFHAGVEPRLVVLRGLSLQQRADLVQLANIGAAVRPRAQHVDKPGRPAVVAGKVHEIGWIFLLSHGGVFQL